MDSEGSNSPCQHPVGIFDSGVGGLTVVKAVRDLLPQEPIIYFGDTARVPYGGRSPETVIRYSCEVADALVDHGIKCLVVACNTASSVALDTLRERLSIPVIGVVEPGASAAVTASRTGRIGVIGTRATIASGAYEHALLLLRPNARVRSKACPLFVPLVEEMWLDHPVTYQVIANYVDSLLEDRIDTLVLGCTHYPFLRETIERHCGDAITVIDSAAACAEQLSTLLSKGLAHPDSTTDPILQVLLTDAPDRFLPLANEHLGLGLDTDNIQSIAVDSL